MSHGIWTDEEWAFIRGFNASAQPAVDSVQALRVKEHQSYRNARRAYLFVGIVLGWMAAVCAHLIAHRFAGECFDISYPAAQAPVVERPVLPGT